MQVACKLESHTLNSMVLLLYSILPAPHVTVFPKLLALIQGNEVVVNISCIVSHPGLPVFVTEGERELQNDGRFMLSHDGDDYILTLSYRADETISGEPFTCHVRNPEMPTESIGNDTTSVRIVPGENMKHCSNTSSTKLQREQCRFAFIQTLEIQSGALQKSIGISIPTVLG